MTSGQRLIVVKRFQEYIADQNKLGKYITLNQLNILMIFGVLKSLLDTGRKYSGVSSLPQSNVEYKVNRVRVKMLLRICIVNVYKWCSFIASYFFKLYIESIIITFRGCLVCVAVIK